MWVEGGAALIAWFGGSDSGNGAGELYGLLSIHPLLDLCADSISVALCHTPFLLPLLSGWAGEWMGGCRSNTSWMAMSRITSHT